MSIKMKGIDKDSLSKRAKKALGLINFGYSKIIDVYEDCDYCEFTLYEAGDFRDFRVYNDGKVYER